jgi:hypothetical protein
MTDKNEAVKSGDVDKDASKTKGPESFAYVLIIRLSFEATSRRGP